jgi:TfoX N-terminal domain
MAYDEELADRIRALVPGDAVEKRMFGGLAFLVGGHMAVAASGQGGLLVRVDPEDGLEREPHAAPMEMRGRSMAGWLRVEAEGVQGDDELATWVQRGVAYASSLPPKG